MIMTYSDSFGMLVTSARARSMTRWKQVWMWRRQRALNVWRWGRMLWSWYAETSDSVWIHAYDVGLGTGISAFPYYIIMLILTFLSFLCWIHLSLSKETGTVVAKLWINSSWNKNSPGRSRKWENHTAEGSQRGVVSYGLMHFTLPCWILLGNDPGFPFPFLGRLWSLSSSWLWKGNAAAIQSWLGRRIKCGSRFCTLVKDDCSRLVSFRSFRQDKVSSGIILAIWFALMCNHRESKSI
jgi:hypothetical protein